MDGKALAKGIAKISLVVFALALVGFFVLRYFSPVSAAHDANVTIYPNIANCNQLGNTFTVNVYNQGPDNLLQVEIYKALAGISEFECGPAPAGWTLFSYEDRCIYVTGLNSTYKIIPGSSLNFTFNATMSSDSCTSVFTVVTVDDKRPVGDRKTYDVTVLIDCVPPSITKTVGQPNIPSIPSSGFDYWVTSNTPINITASDNTDECDLGLDYCRWRVTLDGAVGDWNYVENGDVLSWIINLLNDSNHYLEVECYDIAKNKAILTENDKVDNTPPVTTKQFNGPQHSADGVEWIDGITKVTLNPTDPDPTQHQCNVGVEKTWYVNTLSKDEEPCWDPKGYCKPICDNPYSNPNSVKCINEVQEHCTEYWKEENFSSWEDCVEYYVYEKCGINCDGLKWKLYRGVPIPKDEESCHILQFFSVDYLGNFEDMKVNCFFVDKTPPEVTKIVNQPKVEELDLERLGNGKADWVISQSYSGNSSAKLVIPDNAAGTDFAGVDSFFDVFVELDDITSLSYYRKVVKFDNGWSPLVILGIDADGDGKFEAKPLEWEASLSAGSVDPSLLGDDSFIQCEAETGLSEPDLDWVYVDAYNTFKCYTPNVAGNGYESVYENLIYFQKNVVGRIEPNDKVAMVKIELGGNPTTQENEIAYVDYVEMNKEIIIDEPKGLTWVSYSSNIVFTCTDQGPHPSGNEQICYKVSYDSPEKWDYITDKYCSHPLNEDGYCCEQATVSKPFTFNFKEETMHNLEYYCEDAVEKKSDVYIQFYKVDNTPPSITKTMIGEDHLGKCPPTQQGDVCYVKDDGKNGVSVGVKDGGEICAVGGITCEWGYYWNNSFYGWYTETEFPFDIIFVKDSEHEFHIKCWDALGNQMVEDVETFLVDSTPPVTTKTYGQPFYTDGYADWITSQTPIILNATDAKVGVDKTYYRITGPIDEYYCWDQSFCAKAQGGAYDFKEYVVYPPLTIPNESCHLIEYYSVDKLGNSETVKKQCVFVDNTKPKTWVEVGEPSIGFDFCNNGKGWSIPGPSDICFTFQTAHVHDLGKIFEPRNVYMEFMPGYNNGCQDTAIFYYSKDGSNWTQFYNESVTSVWTPEGWKKYNTTQYVPGNFRYIKIEIPNCYNDYSSAYTGEVWVRDHVTPIDIYCEDQEPHPVDNSHLYYRYKVDNGDWTNWTDPNGYEAHKKIIFEEDSVHYLQYYCVDALGNSDGTAEQPYEKVYKVDSTPPTVTKTVGEPKIQCIEDCDWWVTQNTEITLTAVDGGEICAVGGVKCYYRYGVDSQPGTETFFDDVESGADDWTATGLWHITEYRSYSPTHSWAYNKESDHNYDTGSANSGELISKDISLGFNNPQLTFWSWEQTECGGYCSYDVREVYVNDGSGWVKVWYSTGPENQWHQVTIDLSAYEGKTVKIKFRFDTIDFMFNNYEGWYVDDIQVTNVEKWTEYTGPFKFKEDSVHYLQYFCIDALGNKGQIQTETDKVDSTPPTTRKEYGKPFYTNDYSDWIAITTPITLTAEDGGKTCHVGWNFTKYRYCLYQGCYESEEPCSCPETPWLDYKEPFTIPEDSEHCIEFYSEDKLGNKETVKSQCVYVDNKAPNVTKEISEPKEKWEGDNTFYPNLKERCASGEIECWKITLGTTLNLSCEDQQPHPVNHDTMCFQIELDAEDTTQEYCRYYNGKYNESGDGYCCIEGGIENFQFLEESQHDLKVKCIDYLGNEGPVDEEKFKVEGCPFEICLNKKWNLISVPFTLFDSSPETVFKNITDKIVSVWTYDPSECPNDGWCVWTPEAGNLKEIKPGWGYWVLAKEDEVCFEIAGSLMSPLEVPPSRTLQPGWNLIGYYGNTGMNGDRNSIKPNCSIASRPVYCALNSLVDTQIGFPRWSSLYTYYNNGNDKAYWDGLDACVGMWWGTEYMYPGKGYWIEMDVKDSYAPATNCIWNKDLKCVLE